MQTSGEEFKQCFCFKLWTPAFSEFYWKLILIKTSVFCTNVFMWKFHGNRILRSKLEWDYNWTFWMTACLKNMFIKLNMHRKTPKAFLSVPLKYHMVNGEYNHKVDLENLMKFDGIFQVLCIIHFLRSWWHITVFIQKWLHISLTFKHPCEFFW